MGEKRGEEGRDLDELLEEVNLGEEPWWVTGNRIS